MDRIRQQVHQLTTALRGSRHDVGTRFVRRLRDVAPEYYAIDAGDFQDAGWAALFVVVDDVLTSLDAGEVPVALPRELLEESSAAARSGLPWEVLDRTYRLTHQVLWESMFPELMALKLPRDDEALVLRAASDVLFRYFDQLSVSAGQVYTDAKREHEGRREHRNAQLVKQILDGVAVRDAQLGYRLAQTHIAIVAWGGDPRDEIVAVARRLGAELLTIPAGGNHLWAWLGLPADRAIIDVRAAITAEAGHGFALGSPAQGRAGFVVSHRQAKLAASLWARKLLSYSTSVISFDEVAMQVVALENEDTARIFVDHQLRPLTEDGPRGRELRDTLVAYSRSGLNARVAGTLLGVAERTVRYRVERLETLLGQGFRERLPQLVLAATLAEALDAQRQAREPREINPAP
ncbi:hypothetical protein BH11ACT6_BH11ACT6_40780 [soil metagenome]